jgi:hypothetical protein
MVPTAVAPRRRDEFGLWGRRTGKGEISLRGGIIASRLIEKPNALRVSRKEELPYLPVHERRTCKRRSASDLAKRVAMFRFLLLDVILSMNTPRRSN